MFFLRDGDITYRWGALPHYGEPLTTPTPTPTPRYEVALDTWPRYEVALDAAPGTQLVDVGRHCPHGSRASTTRVTAANTNTEEPCVSVDPTMATSRKIWGCTGRAAVPPGHAAAGRLPALARSGAVLAAELLQLQTRSTAAKIRAERCLATAYPTRSCPRRRFKLVGVHTLALQAGANSLPPKPAGATRVVCISDTHGRHADLDVWLRAPAPAPRAAGTELAAEAVVDVDVLVHGGDFTNTGTRAEVAGFAGWLDSLASIPLKVVVPGNHDLTLDAEFYAREWDKWHDTDQGSGDARARLARSCTVLTQGAVELATGLRIFGSSAQPRLPKKRPQMAFGMTRGAELKRAWASVPAGGAVDVLVTHSPPHQIHDAARGASIGCEELRKRVGAIAPALHVFGHAHDGYGVQRTRKTCFVNASSVTARRGAGGALNPPIVVDLLAAAVREPPGRPGPPAPAHASSL